MEQVRKSKDDLWSNVCSSILVVVREGTTRWPGPEADDVGDSAEGELPG